MGIPILRQSWDCLISLMGIPKVVRHLHIESDLGSMFPRWHDMETLFNISDLLWDESTSQWWFPSQTTSNAKQAIEQTADSLVICNALILVWRHCNVIVGCQWCKMSHISDLNFLRAKNHVTLQKIRTKEKYTFLGNVSVVFTKGPCKKQERQTGIKFQQ